MNNKELITKWVLEKVEEEYKDDIALVVSHNTLRLESEKGTPSVSYFIPITDKGRRFARTFILDGVGIDLWGIEWERMEQFADLNEYNISCLADLLLIRIVSFYHRIYRIHSTAFLPLSKRETLFPAA